MNELSVSKHKSHRVLMYISKATEPEVKGILPQCIVSIITVSRKENQKAGLSGVLAYADGYFLQVLEGADDAIERLLHKLKKDKRHKNLNVLVDRKSSKNYFNDKPLKLEPALQSNDYFIDFIRENFTSLENSTITPQKVIERAVSKNPLQERQVERHIERSEKENEEFPFSSCEIKLKAWPRFNSKLPPREFMELCALISQPIAYPLLLAKNPYASEKELNQVLVQLDNAKLLAVNKLLSSPPVEKLERAGRAESVERVDREDFFFKMKSFLGRIR